MSTYFIWYLFLRVYLPDIQQPIALAEETCLSSEEQKLHQLINRYRKQKKLSAIPLATALTQVAQAHVEDLAENYKHSNRCNPHSWSKKGEWSPCCYAPDHKKASCMWDKPKEIAGYNSPGYEIVFWHSKEATAEESLMGWRKSWEHNQLLINGGQWKKVKWGAVGIGIYQQYAVAWFGEIKDKKGVPPLCYQ